MTAATIGVLRTAAALAATLLLLAGCSGHEAKPSPPPEPEPSVGACQAEWRALEESLRRTGTADAPTNEDMTFRLEQVADSPELGALLHCLTGSPAEPPPDGPD